MIGNERLVIEIRNPAIGNIPRASMPLGSAAGAEHRTMLITDITTGINFGAAACRDANTGRPKSDNLDKPNQRRSDATLTVVCCSYLRHNGCSLRRSVRT